MELDVPAQILEGRTMVPLRFLSEAFGARVGWDGIQQLVSITYPVQVAWFALGRRLPLG